jgi:Putative zinc-finger
MSPEWHAPAIQLVDFRDGTIGPVHAASVEAHLLACVECRAALAAVTPSDGRQNRVWSQIADEIDRPGRAFSPPWTWARVTLGSPPLLGATLLTVLAVLVAPLLVGAMNGRAGVTALLGLAPLAPVVGAAVAFRPTVDPAGQLAAAAPMATMRLVVLRALVVTVAALPLGILAAIAFPVRTSLLLGWIVPGVALCLVVLAAGTRFEPTRLAIGLALGWLMVVTSFAHRARRGDVTTRLSDWIVNQPATQVAFALVAVAAAVVLVMRRDTVVNWRMS